MVFLNTDRVFILVLKIMKIYYPPKKKKKLDLTLSQVMCGKVDRDIGYTLRGRWSSLGDRG